MHIKSSKRKINTLINKLYYSFICTSEKRALRVRISALFIVITFENYERYFFYEILVLIKSKNINVCCFF